MMNAIKSLFKVIPQAWSIIRENNKKQKDAHERSEIARLFNDRYTYVKPHKRGDNSVFSHAWMCPSCNSIHYPVELSVFSGLQYPACCSHSIGHRLDDKINKG
jgi:hypothetical protein